MIYLVQQAVQELGSWVFKLVIKMAILAGAGWLAWRFIWPVVSVRLGF